MLPGLKNEFTDLATKESNYFCQYNGTRYSFFILKKILCGCHLVVADSRSIFTPFSLAKKDLVG